MTGLPAMREDLGEIVQFTAQVGFALSDWFIGPEERNELGAGQWAPFGHQITEQRNRTL
ncbi:MAG: hypothetical protein R2932_01545 [Caldilineaceae bacterium]